MLTLEDDVRYSMTLAAIACLMTLGLGATAASAAPPQERADVLKQRAKAVSQANVVRFRKAVAAQQVRSTPEPGKALAGRKLVPKKALPPKLTVHPAVLKAMKDARPIKVKRAR